ncbi:MAG TPA: DUF2934 domain-containing protein [Bryobacteraceae bacterium]|nr:DUF2934 domain-containing protein [Bryobacteraceae bacterium]
MKALTFMPSKRVSEKDIVVTGATSARHKPAAQRVKRTAPVAAAEPPITQPVLETATGEQIAALAYSYWEARGFQGGSPEQDWLRAERELMATTPATATATA